MKYDSTNNSACVILDLFKLYLAIYTVRQTIHTDPVKSNIFKTEGADNVNAIGSETEFGELSSNSVCCLSLLQRCSCENNKRICYPPRYGISSRLDLAL